VTNVVFVSPFFLPATLRFVDAVGTLPGVRLGLVSQDPTDRLDPRIKARIVRHYQVRDGLDAQSIADAVRWMGKELGSVDRLLGTLEQLQIPLAQVRDLLGLDGMRETAARNFREKSQMKDVLRAAGVPVARHKLCASVDDARSLSREVGYPLVAKPPAGAGAISTFQLNNDEELDRIMASLQPAPGREVQVEEFVQGLERSFEVVSIRGTPVWHSLTRYAPPPLEVLRNPWIQWTVLLPREVEHEAYDETRRVGFAALKALGMGTGLSHMEWFRRQDNTVVVSEIAARPPGAQIMNLMTWSTGVDFWKAWARLVVYEEWEKPVRHWAAGVAFLRGQGDGRRITKVHGLDEAQKEVGGLVVEVKLPEVGMAPRPGYEGEGWVIVRHERTDVVEQALKALIQTVRVELG
jgi:phosphoribosylaminoimidazole carboxylase (NCAIR synthetase)